MPKLKTKEDGSPVYTNGKLVAVGDDGREVEFDPIQNHQTLQTIRDERDTWKGKAETAETELQAFGKSEADRAKARERMKLAMALDESKLIEAGKVDQVVAERLNAAKAEWDAEKQGLSTKADQLNSQLRKVLISNRFATTKALEEYFLTPDLAEAVLGQHFDVEGDAVVAFADPTKKAKLYSRSDPAKLADVDEAISILLKAHPNHDKWKKGANADGSGAPGNPNPGKPPDPNLSDVAQLEQIFAGNAG